MIAADDLLRRVNGTEVTFSVDLGMVEPPVKRVNSTMAGRQRNITKAQYQSMYDSEHEKLIKAEKHIIDYESNGYLTPKQYADLRKVQDDPAIPSQVREALARTFESSRTDPMTEIPTVAAAMENKRRG